LTQNAGLSVFLLIHGVGERDDGDSVQVTEVFFYTGQAIQDVSL
jgi:hypothetical protein